MGGGDIQDFKVKRIEKAIYRAANAETEKDISYFAFALLDYAGIRLCNGYELCILFESIEVMLNGRKLILITFYEKEFFMLISPKLGFMERIRNHEFENGLIISQLHSTFFSRKNDEVKEIATLSNKNEYNDMLKLLDDMSVLKF
jgi:hypothetical protein